MRWCATCRDSECEHIPPPTWPWRVGPPVFVFLFLWGLSALITHCAPEQTPTAECRCSP